MDSHCTHALARGEHDDEVGQESPLRLGRVGVNSVRTHAEDVVRRGVRHVQKKEL